MGWNSPQTEQSIVWLYRRLVLLALGPPDIIRPAGDKLTHSRLRNDHNRIHHRRSRVVCMPRRVAGGGSYSSYDVPDTRFCGLSFPGANVTCNLWQRFARYRGALGARQTKWP